MEALLNVFMESHRNGPGDSKQKQTSYRTQSGKKEVKKISTIKLSNSLMKFKAFFSYAGSAFMSSILDTYAQSIYRSKVIGK